VRRRGFLSLALVLATPRAHADVRYPDVVPGAALAFPRDEGAHPAFRTEWWYVTGWLRDARQHEYGFQLTFFRNRPGVAEASTSAFAPKQLLFAHAALADPAKGRLTVDERAAREGFGLAYANEGRTDVAIDDWSLSERQGTYAGRVRARGFTLDLSFAKSAPILLEGDAGFSRKGPSELDASYYYSLPQLRVQGTLRRDARSDDVTGIAWLDHEWSSRLLASGAVGWDWTGINFDDGSALMAFRIRAADGGVVWASATHRDGAGRTTTYAPQQVSFVAQRHWRSPRTGTEYPIAFAIRAGDLSIVLDPLMPDQELDARGAIGVVYWEGAVRALVDGRIAGRGYLELTGYGKPLRI
jgi:predicted secreted hydrolase